MLRVDADSSSPEQLLQHLQSDVATTGSMRDKLGVLQERLPAVQGTLDECASVACQHLRQHHTQVDCLDLNQSRLWH
jgi:hypothetical protein